MVESAKISGGLCTHSDDKHRTRLTQLYQRPGMIFFNSVWGPGETACFSSSILVFV